MEKNLIDSIKNASKYWWVSLLVGILGLCLGVFSLMNPISTILALTIVFVISFFISGFTQIFYAFASKDISSSWGWTLASGIINLILGVLLLTMPGGNIAVFLLYIGFMILFESLIGLGLSIQLCSAKAKGAGFTVVLAILGIIFSFFLIANLAFTAAFITAIMAFTFFAFGIFRIAYAFKIKSVGKDLDNLKENIDNFKDKLNLK